jgi:hypothetical protein
VSEDDFETRQMNFLKEFNRLDGTFGSDFSRVKTAIRTLMEHEHLAEVFTCFGPGIITISQQAPSLDSVSPRYSEE